MTPLTLLAVLLLCLLSPHPHPHPHAAAGSPDPTPTPWPHQFHAALLAGYGDDNMVFLVNLWYDWPGGRILHDIRSCDTPSYYAEWSNGTSFFHTPARRACRSAEVGVGILRPDWLATGAAYLGRARQDGKDCHIWSKAGLVTYYEDVATGHPVKWVFYTGQTTHVMSFDPGRLPEDVEWQAPAYCFTDDGGTTKEAIFSEGDTHDDGSIIPKIRTLRGAEWSYAHISLNRFL